MPALRVSRRSLELMDRVVDGATDGAHGPPGPDGLMEVEVSQDVLDHYAGIRQEGETLAETVERALEAHLGIGN